MLFSKMSKNLLDWAILAAWILAWCSDSNNTINEGNEMVKDSITIIKDSVNKMLKEAVDQDIHNCVWGNRNMKRKKFPLLETEAVEVKVKGDTANSRVDDLIRMYEDWIDDWDEMKEYMKQNREQSDYYSVWAFIIPDIEWKGSYEVDEYDTDKELEDHIRFTENAK